MNVIVRAVVLALLLTTAACAMGFQGSAHVENGPAGCQAKCQRWGMRLAGMVAVGEYSDGCICMAQDASASQAGSVAAVGPAAVGVITAVRQRQQAAAAAQHR
ncbi:MAG: hypothetical protein HYY06_13970 [Deltaproteobacteria bacterium]|nr:hypothetical protein [Deltaproteobacteria bacterium]